MASPLSAVRLIAVVILCDFVGCPGVTLVFTCGHTGLAEVFSCGFVILGVFRVFSVGHDTSKVLGRIETPGRREVREGSCARGGGVGSLGVMATAETIGQCCSDNGLMVRRGGRDGFSVGHTGTEGGLVVRLLPVGHGAGGGSFRDLPVGQSIISGPEVVVVGGLSMEGKGR